MELVELMRSFLGATRDAYAFGFGVAGVEASGANEE